jgi:hypothetical protein
VERPIIVITGRGRPHELLFLAYPLVTGAAFLLGAPRPSSMGDELGAVWGYVWAVGLLLSGVVGLVGCFWRRDLIRGLLLERAGMLFGAAAALGYATQVYNVNGGRSLFGAGFCVAWAVANMVRAVQISNDLRSLRRATHVQSEQ